MMKRFLTTTKWQLCSLLVVLAFATQAEPNPFEANFSQFQLSRGETPDWLNPDFQTSDSRALFSYMKERQFDGVVWIRWQIEVTGGYLPSRDMIYWLHNGLAAYELYWDDKLVGTSGKVGGDINEEVPGNIDNQFLLPNSWITKGIHHTSIKFSSYHRPAGYELFRLIEIKPYSGENRYFSLNSLLPTLLVSIALMIGVYFFTLYLSDRENKGYLIFSLMCADLFIFGLSLQWPHMIGYTYDWHAFNNYVGNITGAIFPILLPLFFMFKYRQQRLWPVVLVLPASAIVLIDMEGGENLYWALGLILSAGVSAWAVKTEKGKYWWELLGLVVCIFGVLSSQTNLEDFFYFFPLLVMFILVSNAIEAQRQKQASFRFQLKSSQLEAQLLRKNIQPHFILNSLTSLMEWVETSPEKSVEFIAALADEFRLFAEVSGKEFIEVGKEFELCRKHLAIMAFRLQQKYTLTCDGFNQSDKIPPGVVHTLLENAFSHNDYGKSDVEFSLHKLSSEGKVIIKFSAPLKGSQQSKFSHLGTGTGLSFIRSQLSQCYGDKWHLEQHKRDNEWVTELTIPQTDFL